MSDDAFNEFVANAVEFLRERIAQARLAFGIGDSERYDYDLPSGRFWWSDAGVPQVEASVIVVGSISTRSNTWLWSWANTHFDDVRSPEIERVREYGLLHGFEPLTEAKWSGDERDGWEMTAVSAFLLDASAAYRSPSTNGALFLLLDHLKVVA
jgi:hypothetical protein